MCKMAPYGFYSVIQVSGIPAYPNMIKKTLFIPFPWYAVKLLHPSDGVHADLVTALVTSFQFLIFIFFLREPFCLVS